jgi:VWFA-related protein
MTNIPITVCAMVLAVATMAAQNPPPQQPPQQGQQQPPMTTFRSAVDLVPVDVNVVDGEGRPITGLEVDDFTLTVDGKPRRLVSAQYVSAMREPSNAPTPTHYSSNASAAGGRMIMLVVDQGNIGTGRGRAAMGAAQKFIEQLSPADRVGLATIPGTGPQLDFTANHAAVKSQLVRIYGQASPPQIHHDMGIAEALRIERGDRITLQEVTNRACAGLREPAEIALCQSQVIGDSKTLHAIARERTVNSIIALRSLIDRLSLTSAPKSIVFLSEGLIIDREFSELTWLGPAAARAQVVLYVVQLEAPMFDASIARPSPTRTEDRNIAEEGLSVMAGLTRGALLRAPVDAEYAFRRLGLELSGYYLLGFEPESGDRDGRPHKINVSVPNKRGITLRARREFVVGGGPAKSAEQLLVETLRAPLQASDIGVKVSTYTLRDPSSQKLRVLVAAEIDRSVNANASAALGFILFDANGKAVASQIEPGIPRPPAGQERAQLYVGTVLAEAPGLHTLKLAIVDDRGQRGSVEHTFRAQLSSAGQVRSTDLLIAESGTRPDGFVLPAVAGDFSSDYLHGYIELYSDAPDVLEQASVMLEVAGDEQGRTLDSTQARVLPMGTERTRRAAEAAVPIALLPPGDYVARAVINVNGRKSGQISRPFRISRDTPAFTAVGDGTKLPARTPIPFVSRIDRFDRAAVLAPPVVGFFIDRMNFGPDGAAVAPALEHARAGRFDEAAAALGNGGNRQVAQAFLSGLALYSKGDLNGAMEKFRQALKLDSEFFVAAFYLGSCYAAAGKDRDAAGAWRTALVTESDAPFIYTLLADAFLRLKDANRALDILKEASALWPQDDQVQLRYGTALALAGRADEALPVLDGYLTRNPNDHERIFIVLQAIYQTHLTGRSIKSPAEDKALFERYAAMYAAAKGPQGALVETWRKFIESGGRKPPV